VLYLGIKVFLDPKTWISFFNEEDASDLFKKEKNIGWLVVYSFLTLDR